MKKNALVIHSNIYSFGGAEVYAIKIIEQLVLDGYAVTVVHCGGVLDTSRIFQWCGVNISSESVNFVPVPGVSKIFDLLNVKLSLLEYSISSRYARAMASDYDVVISTYGEYFGSCKKLISVVHVPLFVSDEAGLSYLGHKKNYGIKSFGRVFYVNLTKIIAGWSPVLQKSALFICNSCWTRDRLLESYGDSCRTEVLYIGASVGINIGRLFRNEWMSRQNRFSILGRVVPQKNIERAIEIIDELRNRGFDFGLDVIGGGSDDYYNKICNMVKNKPWIKIHGRLDREDLERVVLNNRWGLHCADYEHYGIAAIEMQMLGAIVFVPNCSGQAEVAVSDELKYEDTEDAVDKIAHVVKNIDQLWDYLNNCRERVVENHQGADFGVKFHAIYNKYLNITE